MTLFTFFLSFLSLTVFQGVKFHISDPKEASVVNVMNEWMSELCSDSGKDALKSGNSTANCIFQVPDRLSST